MFEVAAIVSPAYAVDAARVADLAARLAAYDVDVLVGVVDPAYARALRRRVPPHVTVVVVGTPAREAVLAAAGEHGVATAVYAQLTGDGWVLHPAVEGAGARRSPSRAKPGWIQVDTSAGLAVGGSRYHPARRAEPADEWAFLPIASPIGSLAVEVGARPVRVSLGLMSAPTFLTIPDASDFAFLPLVGITAGVLVGGDRFRIGPIGDVAFYAVSAGVRTAILSPEDAWGNQRGVEIRAEYIPLRGGRLAVMYCWTFRP